MAEPTNGKNWLSRGLLQVLIIIALTAYIAVDKISSNERSDSGNAINERVARLEECVQALRPLPSDMASVKEQVKNIQATVIKIENKLDDIR